MKYQDLVRRADNTKEPESVDLIYFDSISRLRSVQGDLRKLDVIKHLLGVIKPFLVKWGGLGRVVCRRGLDWSLLSQTLRTLEKPFAAIRGRKFLTIDFEDHKISDAIKTIYEKLDLLPYFGSPTTTSKILHLLNPEIFVMWDSAIRKMYKAKDAQVRETPEGYLQFLRDVQRDFLEALNDEARIKGMTLNQVEKETRDRYKGKKIAKIADEYNWTEAHSHMCYQNPK
jgi:hypothetical protein